MVGTSMKYWVSWPRSKVLQSAKACKLVFDPLCYSVVLGDRFDLQ